MRHVVWERRELFSFPFFTSFIFLVRFAPSFDVLLVFALVFFHFLMFACFFLVCFLVLHFPNFQARTRQRSGRYGWIKQRASEERDSHDSWFW